MFGLHYTYQVESWFDILKLGLVTILNLKFSRDADIWLRFCCWRLVEILRMKFDQDLYKTYSTLGAVVHFAMFWNFEWTKWWKGPPGSTIGVGPAFWGRWNNKRLQGKVSHALLLRHWYEIMALYYVKSILTEISASRQDRRVLQKSKIIRIKFLSIWGMLQTSRYI